MKRNSANDGWEYAATAELLTKFTGTNNEIGHHTTNKVNDISVTNLVNLSEEGGIIVKEFNASTGNLTNSVLGVSPAVACVYSGDAQFFPKNSSQYDPTDYTLQSQDSSRSMYGPAHMLATVGLFYDYTQTVIGKQFASEADSYHHVGGNPMPTVYRLMQFCVPSGATIGIGGETMSTTETFVDETPTQNSARLVSSRGLYTAFQNLSSTYALANHNHDASDITTGTFDAARIPDLSSSYLTSVPNLDTSKITTGTFDAARIPDLSTSYVPIPASGSAAGYVVKRNSANDGWEYSASGGAGSVTTDAEMTNGSTNPIQSNWVYDMFREYQSARVKQDLYVLQTNEWMGKANLQIWSNFITSSASTLTSIANSIFQYPAEFFTFNGWPGTLGVGVSYYNTSVPPVINTGTSDFKVDNMTFTDNFIARWSFTTFVYIQGDYYFRVTSNEGCRLQIRSTAIIDNQTSAQTVINREASGTHTNVESSAFEMKRGRTYEVQFFWFEGSNTQSCKLEWKRPGDSNYSVFSPYINSPEFQYYHPDFTASKISVGLYSITFGEKCKPQSNSYTLQLTPQTSHGTTVHYTKTPTGFVANTLSNMDHQIWMTNNLDTAVNHGDGVPEVGDIPTDDADWREYPSWNTSSATVISFTSSIFQLSSTGVQVLEAGVYEVTAQLCIFRSGSTQRADVGMMVAKNGTREGPVAAMSYIRANGDQFASGVTVNYTVVCAANDELSIYTTRLSMGGTIETKAGFSQLKVERKSSGIGGYNQDCAFDFTCISRGRVFCHGTINSDGTTNEEQNYA